MEEFNFLVYSLFLLLHTFALGAFVRSSSWQLCSSPVEIRKISNTCK